MTHSSKRTPLGRVQVAHRAALFGLTGFLLLGCGEVRQDDDAANIVSYTETVAPLLAARCVGCHSGSTASGSYDLSSYRGLLGPGSDTTRNAVPGDVTSRLLTKLDATKEVTHWKHLLPKSVELKEGETAETRRDADFLLLKAWVLTFGLAYMDSAIHPPGWVYPGKRSSQSFHGGALRANAWSTTGCQECHGQDLKGSSKKGGGSCQTCHTSGTSSCTVCHGESKTGSAAPPMDLSWNLSATSRGVGAHAAHLRGSQLMSPVLCSDCHKVPASTEADGHLLDDSTKKTSDLKAEVVFSAAASKDSVTAAYDATAGTCTVSCHGAGVTDAGSQAKPSWTSSKKMDCQSCHAAPHKSPAMGGADCSLCHQQVFSQCVTGGTSCFTVSSASSVKLALVSKTLHGDGKVSLGKAGAGTCDGCHGTTASKGAPAPDLQGKTDTTLVSVGLHKVHLQGGGGYASPVTCADCHKVPATLKAAGHLDSALPAEVTFSALATNNGKVTPVWDRTKKTCTNVYCHSLDGGKVSSWTWTAAASPSLSCTSCHGIPPAKTSTGGNHPSSLICSSCHSSAYNSSTGALDPKKHINGKVDL